MDHIIALDYILLPFYLWLFYAIVKKMSERYSNADLKRFMLIAFGLRMFGCIAYSMLVQYYYGYGDSFTYFDGGAFFTEQISKNFSNFSYLFAPFAETTEFFHATSLETGMAGYFQNPATNMVMRITAIFSFLSFKTFLITSLFFGLFSFLGQWKLFLVLDKINKHRNTNLMAFAILFTPSIWFWGSGLLKDSLCLGAVGFIIHFMYKFFVEKKFSLVNLFFLVFLLYIVTIIKSYITTILLISFGAMLFSRFLTTIKSKILRFTTLIIMLSFSGLVVYTSDFSSQLTDIAEESVATIEQFKSNYQEIQETDEGSKAGFGSAETIDASLGSLILSSPGTIFSCLFRPFLWESRKIIILFTSLESTILLYCTLLIMFKGGFFNFFRTIFRTPFLLFCFIMSMLFALVIGFTTFNFGTMIRYKIIFLPFYYFILVELYTRYSEAKKAVKVGDSINLTTTIA